ncbi:hypothetical protein C8Q79DRAFT_1007343 [Trametes meyenii]|nr:hypothetical protein C8Q79DRAFT_1007343 [Trametes meyenii]
MDHEEILQEGYVEQSPQAGLPQPQQAGSTPQQPRNRLRIRELEFFTGDRSNYRTWKSQMKRYLAAHSQATEDELITVVLMSGIRGTNVDEWVNAYAGQHFGGEDEAEGEWDVTLAEVWHELDRAYADWVGEHLALQQMRNLRQQAGKANEYFLEYERLIWQAGLEKTDRMVLEYLKDAICDHFRRAIYNREVLPQTYQAWKMAVLNLDSNYMHEQAIAQNRNTRTTPTPPNTPAGGARTDGTGVTYGGAGQPMEIDRARTRTPGLCRMCGNRKWQRAPGCTNPWHDMQPYFRTAAPPSTEPNQRMREISTTLSNEQWAQLG